MNENNLIKKFLNLKGEKNIMRNIKKICNKVVGKVQTANSAVRNFFKEKKDGVVRTMKKQWVLDLCVVLALVALMVAIVIVPAVPSSYVYVYLFKEKINMEFWCWQDSLAATVMLGSAFALFGKILVKLGKTKFSNNQIEKAVRKAVSLFSICLYKYIAVFIIGLKYARYGFMLVKRDGTLVTLSGAVIEMLKNPYGDMIDEDVKKEIDRHTFKTFFKSEREIKNRKKI